MHEAAYQYVADAVAQYGPFERVLEVGGRDVNGSVRGLFECDRYWAVDIEDGPGVDEVADFGTYKVTAGWDAVVCCEVLEHAQEAQRIVANAYRALNVKGLFVMTCAGIGRPEHSAVDGGRLRAGEFYRNVGAELLEHWLEQAGFGWWSIDEVGQDTRCVAGR